MSVRKDFEERISVLAGAGGGLTVRLVGLLKWMNEQKEIVPILMQLRSPSPVTNMLNSDDAQRYHKVNSLANTPEEVARTGLAMLEYCSLPTQKASVTPLYAIAMKFGIVLRHGGAEAINEHAMDKFIFPMFKYIINRLPEDSLDWTQESASLILNTHPVSIQQSLKLFQRDHPNSGKVAFVMMQFSNTSAHGEIEAAIKATLTKHGFTGVLARDKEYHDEMLPNIQTYMHGCGFGIGVFERIQREVFNPNVSLEVGYMMALNKPVLLLKDKSLSALLTDLVGKLYRSFDVFQPAETIPKEIGSWMRDKGLIS
jgi:hypothetical protein